MIPWRATASLVAMASMVAMPQRPAVFIGKAYVAADLKPLSGVEVTVVELSRTQTTDGNGAFRMDSIPPGAYTVRARKIGYAQYEARLSFDRRERVEEALLLPRLDKLDTVHVVGAAGAPLDFFEHKAIGLGHFLTRADLEKAGARHIGDIIRDTPGAGVMRGRGAEAWLVSKRPPPSLSTDCSQKGTFGRNVPGQSVYCPENSERLRGLEAGCFARVYFNRTLLNSATPAEPVDVNQFAAMSIEAVEYYSGPAQTPPQYSRLNSGCGVLVLHVRKK